MSPERGFTTNWSGSVGGGSSSEQTDNVDEQTDDIDEQTDDVDEQTDDVDECSTEGSGESVSRARRRASERGECTWAAACSASALLVC